MKQILFRISSQDNSFPDFYEPLAYALRDQGTVYTPHPIIPPNARVAIPMPSEILVALNSADGFATVYQSICDYLERDEERELTLERGEYIITLTERRIPAERALIDRIVPE